MTSQATASMRLVDTDGTPRAPLSPVEEARIDLAAALRWAARFEMNESIQNHFTLAVPGVEDRYLVNPHDLHWSEVRACDLLIVDGDGVIYEGNHPVDRTAVSIHGAIHRKRASAKCVLHTHMRHVTALSMLEGWRMEYTQQGACKFYDRIAYDDDTGFQGLAFDGSEAQRMADAMGDKSILVLANHGVVVTGPTVAEAFDDLYYLEKVAEMQILAMSTGRKIRHIEPRVAAFTREQMAQGKGRGAHFHFNALKRVLARREPDFQDL
ncbi:MAG TPA: aldolase [Alphaproteobacteria bacterium]